MTILNRANRLQEDEKYKESLQEGARASTIHGLGAGMLAGLGAYTATHSTSLSKSTRISIVIVTSLVISNFVMHYSYQQFTEPLVMERRILAHQRGEAARRQWIQELEASKSESQTKLS